MFSDNIIINNNLVDENINLIEKNNENFNENLANIIINNLEKSKNNMKISFDEFKNK